MRKRWIALSLLLVASAAAVMAYFNIAKPGSGALEQWIGSQLQEIANGYLDPRLSFTDLDYQYPSTVHLKSMRLVAVDPMNGSPVPIVAAEGATITLAQIPERGKPVVIEQIILDKPVVKLLSVAPGSTRLVGFSHILRQSPTSAPTTHETPVPTSPQPTVSTTQPTVVPATQPATQRRKLTDVFQMRLVQINEGRVVYDPRIPGTEPMELDHITTRMDISSSADGWYTLGAKLSREPIFSMKAAGRLNLDDFRVADLMLTLEANLDADKLNYLPPQLQKQLLKYETRGALSAKLSGGFPILRPSDGELKSELHLTDAFLTLSEYQIPIDRLDIACNLHDGRVEFPSVTLAALKGSLDLQGAVQLNQPLTTDLSLRVVKMTMEDTLKKGRESAEPKYAGVLSGELELHVPARYLADHISGRSDASKLDLPDNWGSSHVNIEQARLLETPLVHSLNEAFKKTTAIVTGDSGPSRTDKLESRVQFQKDAIDFREIYYIGKVVAARGRGTVWLDRRLDMEFNAGPIEKVQSLFGSQVGGAMGKLTDLIASYRVDGTIEKPRVQLVVAGGVVKDIGEGIGKGVKGMGDAIKGIFDK